ncbi:MAG: hypothetical protein V1685_01260 [Parcubacteria group bacterium]
MRFLAVCASVVLGYPIALVLLLALWVVMAIPRAIQAGLFHQYWKLGTRHEVGRTAGAV